jgi:exosortase
MAPEAARVELERAAPAGVRTSNLSLLQKLLLGAIASAIAAFFCVVPIYAHRSIMLWAWQHWLPSLDQEHGKLVIPISALIIWYHRKRLRSAAVIPSNWGWWFIVGGIALVLLGTRAQQPRITLLALPVLLFGIILAAWGRQVAKILFFPIFFLIFMIPIGALQQASFRLQFLITGAVKGISSLIGIHLDSVGTTLREMHGAWGFDIAEGCSGIRSLVAIIMLTAIYAHIFEPTLWKKLALMACSIGFAVIANIGRILTIILIARLGYPGFAGGPYHEYSGFVSFPFALGAMLVCHKLLNISGRSAARPVS